MIYCEIKGRDSMAKDLEKGTVLKSMMGIDITIDKKLGEGGQGYVYKIDYAGQPKAVKIYKPASLHDPKAFYQNLHNNVVKGAPSDRFLWPIDMLRWDGKTFGYIMDLRPQEYYELVDYMNVKKPEVRFQSYAAAVNAALEMTTAFRLLHSKGYSYQDLSDGNFFIHPRTGRILICDNDNVSEYGKNSGILGTPQYMAPEIVRGEAKPDVFTDRYSLAVIIFIILTMTHPLEGKRHLCEILTPKNERILYGTDPIFILDPIDRRNAPVEGIHQFIGSVWKEFPDYVKEMFIRQFSKEIMMTPQKRATETDWQEMLMHLKSQVVRCPYCHGDNLKFDEHNPVCSDCGKPLQIGGFLELSEVDYHVPLTVGNVIYRSQLASSNIDVAGAPVLQVKRHPKDPTKIVLQNVSNGDMTVVKPDKTRVILGNGKATLAQPDVSIDGYGGRVTVIK